MLLEIVGQSLAHSLLHGTCHLTIAQFGLGLTLKLRFCHLDGDDGSETLAEVLACHFNLGLLYLLGNGWVGIGIFFQCTGQCHTESHQMGSSLYGIDIVYIRMDVFAVIGVVHHCHLDRYTLLFGL